MKVEFGDTACKVKSESVSCLVLSDSLRPRELYSLPDSPVHGILQIRILEWVAFPFSRGSFLPRDWTHISYIADRFFYQLSHPGSLQHVSSLRNSNKKAFQGWVPLIPRALDLCFFWGVRHCFLNRLNLTCFTAVWHLHKLLLKECSVLSWLYLKGRLMNLHSLCSGYPKGLRFQL